MQRGAACQTARAGALARVFRRCICSNALRTRSQRLSPRHHARVPRALSPATGLRRPSRTSHSATSGASHRPAKRNRERAPARRDCKHPQNPTDPERAPALHPAFAGGLRTVASVASRSWPPIGHNVVPTAPHTAPHIMWPGCAPSAARLRGAAQLVDTPRGVAPWPMQPRSNTILLCAARQVLLGAKQHGAFFKVHLRAQRDHRRHRRQEVRTAFSSHPLSFLYGKH